jgi:hypothetical protein
MKNFIFLCSGLAISNSPRRSRILQAAVLISQTAHRKVDVTQAGQQIDDSSLPLVLHVLHIGT